MSKPEQPLVATVQFDPEDDPVAAANNEVASKVPDGDDSKVPSTRPDPPRAGAGS